MTETPLENGSSQQLLQDEIDYYYKAQCDALYAAVYSAAEDGSGPQPWDKEWPLASFDLAEHFSSIDAGPAVLNRLLLMVDWALASAHGRKALIADQQAHNPHQHTLDTIREFRDAIGSRLRALAEDAPVEFTIAIRDFNVFEHFTTCRDFCPDWFTTGELIEMADWALESPAAQRQQLLLPASEPAAGVINTLEVIHEFAEALGVRRKRLLIEQAEESLAYTPETLIRLKEHLGL